MAMFRTPDGVLDMNHVEQLVAVRAGLGRFWEGDGTAYDGPPALALCLTFSHPDRKVDRDLVTVADTEYVEKFCHYLLDFIERTR